MEVVSKLFKTQLKVINIKRDNDKLILQGDPKDPMSANSSMTAKDVGDMAGLAFSWDVLLWAVLFPFYYIGTLLVQRDLDQKIFTGVYVIGNIIISLLLLSSYQYLATYPFLSALLFIGFALAFFAAFLVSDRYGFLYPAVVLAIVTYYLCLSGLGVSSSRFPVFALPLLALIIGGGAYLQRRNQEEISNVLYWTGVTVVVYFLMVICYAAYNTENYLAGSGWVAISSMAGFAVYFGTRAWQDNQESSSYTTLFFLTLAVLIELSFLQFPVAVQGIILFHVGLVYALAGTLLQRTWSLGLVRPYFVVGLILALGSFWSFYNLSHTFTYALLLFAAGALTVSENIHEEKREDEDEPDRAYWFKKAYHYIGNTFGYAALVFYCLTGFPVNNLIIAAALLAALAYWYTGMRNAGAFIEARNQYLYLCSVFMALFLYPLLWRTNPLTVISLNMVFGVIPAGILLCLGTRFSAKEEATKAITVYEALNLFIVLSLILPLFANAHSPLLSLLVTGMFAAMIGGALTAAKHRSLYYAPVLLTASVIFNVGYALIPSHLPIGFAFMLFGVLSMALALVSYRKEWIWSNPLLFGWIVGAVISLSLFWGNKQVLIYSAAVWAMTFALGALYIQRPEKEEATAD